MLRSDQRSINGRGNPADFIWQAIDLARQKAGIDPEEQIEIESFPRTGFSLFKLPSFPSVGTNVENLLSGTLNSDPQLRMPFDIEIR